MGREEDGLPLRIELPQKLPECEATLGVEAGCRLIEEQTAGRWKIARATMSRWAIPPERAKTEAFANLESWNCSSSRSASRRDSRAPMSKSRTVKVEVLPHR